MNEVCESRPVKIDLGRVKLDGDLAIPEGAQGIVAFAHGSGSSRHSPRNGYVARQLNKRGLATLLFDLLTPAEEQEDLMTGRLRFDIELLAERLASAVDWIADEPDTQDLVPGLFGSSTGGGAALVTASRRPSVGAIVCRGSRTDLAGAALAEVSAPTLLIVGERDETVLEFNRESFERLKSRKRLEIIAGATHLFEESGALEQVAQLAADWFYEHLRD